MRLSRVVFVAVICGGLHTQTTPSPFGHVAWLINWSDKLKGRSRNSRSHYATLCTLTLCVFTLLSCNLWTHVTHEFDDSLW